MQQYSQTFQDLVNTATIETEKFYKTNSLETPNPYYIGKGNSRARIMIIGKELAIDPTSKPAEFQNESVENPLQWKKIIDGEETAFDPRLPYGEGYLPRPAGSTWRKYQLLSDLIFHTETSRPYFLHKFFITEANTSPSKYSPGKKNIDFNSRIKFFKNSFYQNFDIIIVAAGGYLHVAQIEELFGVKEIDRSQTTKNNKFIRLSDENQKKLVISTRQLSMAISPELMGRIADEVSLWIRSLEPSKNMSNTSV